MDAKSSSLDRESPVFFDPSLTESPHQSNDSSSPDASTGSFDGIKVERSPTDQKPSLPKSILKKPSSDTVAMLGVSPSLALSSEERRTIRWADKQKQNLENVKIIPDALDASFELVENLKTILTISEDTKQIYIFKKEAATAAKNIPLIRAYSAVKAACEQESLFLSKAIQSSQKNITAISNQRSLLGLAQTRDLDQAEINNLNALPDKIRISNVSTDVFSATAKAAHHIVEFVIARADRIEQELAEPPEALSQERQLLHSMRYWEHATSAAETMNEDEERAYHESLISNNPAISFCIERMMSSEQEARTFADAARKFDQSLLKQK